MDRAALVALDLRVGEVRGQHGEVAPRYRHALRHGPRRVLARDHAGGQHAGEHVVARAPRGVRKAIRAAGLGRLRNGNQQCGLANRQPPRLLAEIGHRGSAHAFQVAAEGCQPQVDAQDLVLRQLPLEGEGEQRLADLARGRAVVLAEQQARDLHGDGGAARDEAAVTEQ